MRSTFYSVTNKILLFLFSALTPGEIINGQSASEEKSSNLTLGYSSIIFQDSKPQDANAAIFIWTEEIRKNVYTDFRQKVDLSTYIFDSPNEIAAALSEDKADILVLPTPDYFILRQKFDLVPSLVGIIDNSPYFQFVLLVRKDSGLNSLADLRNRTLSQPKEEFHPLLNFWISGLLEKKFNVDKNHFFNDVRIEEKEHNAVYSLFFNKSDCAIVEKDLFITLCSLNPQLSNSIKILDASPELISLVTVYSKKSEAKVKNILSWLSNNIHNSTEGQNILRLFKVKRLVKVTDKDLQSTKNLIDEYKNDSSKIVKVPRQGPGRKKKKAD